MTQFTFAIEAKFDGATWSDITSDVYYGSLSYEEGIFDNSPNSRMATPGEMRFELINSEANSAALQGYYSPGHTNCRVGFASGLQVRLTITFDGMTKTKFFGRVIPGGIQPTIGTTGPRRTSVTVRDWLQQAANHEMQSPSFNQNKDAGQVAELVIANMAIAPAYVDYRTCEDVFPNVFDTTRSTTHAITEINKAIVSELGYCYIVHDRTYDEVLRVEGRYTRNDEVSTKTEIPISAASSGFLLQENGDYLLQENGDRIILDEVETLTIDNQISVNGSTSPSYGKHFYNRVKMTANPRETDAAATTTLATLQRATAVPSYSSVSITMRYRDPTGAATRIAGIDMVQPVATTDYLANTLADGTGANLTASFTVVATYGTSDAVLVITNTGATDGFILAGSKVRGRGVRIYDPVDSTAEIADDENGPYQLTMNLPYQDDPNATNEFAAMYLHIYQTQIMTIDSIPLIANRNDQMMMAYMFLEPGCRIGIKEDVTGIDADYYVQGVKAQIDTNNVLAYDLYVKQVDFELFPLFIIGTSLVGGTDVIGF